MNFRRCLKKDKRVLDRRAFSLVELLTVIVIVGVMIVTFDLVFVTNWTASLDRISRATLWQESSAVMESLTRDGRQSRQMDISEDSSMGTKTAVILDTLGQPIATYVINDKGKLQRSDQLGNISVLTEHLDFANSRFEKIGRTLRITLALRDQVFSQLVRVDTSTEIYPRN